MFMFPLKILARKGLRWCVVFVYYLVPVVITKVAIMICSDAVWRKKGLHKMKRQLPFMEKQS